MNTMPNRSDATDPYDLFARLRQGLQRELVLYRRLRSLAESSLTLLGEGRAGREFILLLEAKQALAREVRATQDELRTARSQWNDLGPARAAAHLADLETMTGELEEELRAVLEYEEGIDRLMRAGNFCWEERAPHGGSLSACGPCARSGTSNGGRALSKRNPRGRSSHQPEGRVAGLTFGGTPAGMARASSIKK